VAGAKERFTRSVANMGLETERNSQAVENRTDAVLNHVKTVKELEQMDLSTAKEELAIAQMLGEMARQEEEQLKQDNVNISKESVETDPTASKVVAQPVQNSESMEMSLNQ